MKDRARKITAASVSVGSNSLLVTLKFIVGILIGSVSIMSEAIHSMVDLVAALIALFAVRESSKPADERHPFGHGKVENISAAVEAVLIFVAAGWIIYEAVGKFIHPDEVSSPGLGALLMAFSATLNFFVSRYLFRVGKQTDSLALQADGWHLRTDVWTSIGVTLGMLGIWGGGWAISRMDIPTAQKAMWLDHLHLIDPIAALVVAVLILRAAWRLTTKSIRDLMDVTLPEEEEQWIAGMLIKFGPAVHGFHRMRTRKSGSIRFIEFHIFVDANMTVKDSHYLCHLIAKEIQDHFSGANVTVHVEPCSGNCNHLELHP